MNSLKLMFYIIFEFFKYICKYKNYEDFIISILELIANYNIIFIKIFQWIRINNQTLKNSNYITPRIETHLYSYTNNTPYIYDEIDYKSLLDIYIKANEKGDSIVLTSLEPINSGTISLVFKGKINNKEIAIKILRRNIKKQVEDGINFLINIESIIFHLPIVNRYLGTKIFDTNKSHILNQIDFINESENIALFYNKFKNNKFIKTPCIYQNYTISNNNVIIMEYIEGKYLYQLDEEDLDNYYEPFLKFIITSIFYKKILHSDLHQGNVLFYKETLNNKNTNKIGVIDFGMITKLDTNEIDFMYMWLNGIFNNKFKDFLDYLREPNNILDIFHNYKQINECVDYIENLYVNKEIFIHIDNLEFLIEDINYFLIILKKYNCIISPRYNFFILSLIPALSILNKLGPNVIKKNVIKKNLEKMSNNNLLD